jgi:hypothetical protein
VDRLDDPLIWGILPMSYYFNPDNMRWGLGSYDLCFTNKYTLTRSSRAAETNGVTEDFPLSSHLAKCFLRIDWSIHHTAASSNPLSRKRSGSSVAVHSCAPMPQTRSSTDRYAVPMLETPSRRGR